MGVVRQRGSNLWPASLIVRTTSGDDEEEVVDILKVSKSLAGDVPGPSIVPRDHHGDREDDEEDDANRPPVAITMTIPMPQPTGSALPSGAPGPTLVVELPPPPHRENPTGKGQNGLSETTHHLLIAAGSIGVTIILVMVILAIYTMRNRNMTLRQAVTHGKNRVTKFTRRGSPPTPPKAEMWDRKAVYGADFGAVVKDPVMSPELPMKAMSLQRSDSGSSQKRLVALERNDSFNTKPQYPGPQSSFFLDSPLQRKPPHARNNSVTPSSPGALPIHDQPRHLSSQSSQVRYPEPPTTRPLSPLPPPPTFKQFLSKANSNRPSASNLPFALGYGRMNAMVSRFSWTNSNAPQTPHDTARDTNSHASPGGAGTGIGRDSFMTQRSSVPRFRTIDSWVNHQAGRIDETKLKELAQKQARWTASTTGGVIGPDMYAAEQPKDTKTPIPDVPKIPTDMENEPVPTPSPNTLDPLPSIPGTTATTIASSLTLPTPKPTRSSLPLLPSLPGKNVKHDRTSTRTTVETARIFRAHPGEEVRFSTRSAVPSEVLDADGGVGRAISVLESR